MPIRLPLSGKVLHQLELLLINGSNSSKNLCKVHLELAPILKCLPNHLQVVFLLVQVSNKFRDPLNQSKARLNNTVFQMDIKGINLLNKQRLLSSTVLQMDIKGINLLNKQRLLSNNSRLSSNTNNSLLNNNSNLQINTNNSLLSSNVLPTMDSNTTLAKDTILAIPLDPTVLLHKCRGHLTTNMGSTGTIGLNLNPKTSSSRKRPEKLFEGL